jgi:hypothetical protein
MSVYVCDYVHILNCDNRSTCMTEPTDAPSSQVNDWFAWIESLISRSFCKKITLNICIILPPFINIRCFETEGVHPFFNKAKELRTHKIVQEISRHFCSNILVIGLC